jgi:hypothetical protein
VEPAVYWECIQFVNTRVAASSEGAFQASFSSCIKEGHLLQVADLVSATSNGAENTTVLVDQAAYLLVSATSNGAEISTVLADQAANLLVSAAVNGAEIFCTILAEVLLLLVNHHFGMPSFHFHACMLY